jgi:glucose 1-dehydrogenase
LIRKTINVNDQLRSVEIAFVTGASSGIGATITQSLLDRGWTVFGLTHRHELNFSHENLIWVKSDLSKANAAAEIVEFLTHRLVGKKIQAFINCAGVYTEAPILPESECEFIVRVNLIAPYQLSLALVPLMSNPSTIILFSSVASHKACSNSEIYGATKAGIESLVTSLGYRLGIRGIRTVGIAPGLVRTPMSESRFLNQEFVDRVSRRTPLQRTCTTEDIAAAALLFLRPEGIWCTGQTMIVDGGESLGYGDPIEI